MFVYKFASVYIFKINFQMQMIHFKEEYGSTQLAQAHSDGLAVLVIFFTVGLSINIALINHHCTHTIGRCPVKA